MNSLSPTRSAALRLVAALATAVLLTCCVLAGTARTAVNTFCNSGTTTYVGTDGNWGNGDNWSNGLPVAACDAVVPTGATVTLTTAPGQEQASTAPGAAAASLSIAAGATVIVEGVASNGEQGNVSQATTLNVGGLTVAQGGALDLEATADLASSGSNPGQTPGGSANVNVDSGSSTPAQVNNAGTITASSSDPAWGESLNVGGTLTNTGTIADASGLLTFQGQSLPYVVANSGTMSIAPDAAFTMIAGDGSSFNNTGSFANLGTATLQQSMHWVQSGGSETGNPVQLTGREQLQDSAGRGAFEVSNCGAAGLVGTIPAGQTVTVLGGCSGTSLNLGSDSSSPPVVNDGTLVLDNPGGPGAGAILQGVELDNHGTLQSTVAAPALVNQLLVPVVNEPGATVDVSGGQLVQTAGTATTNAGTVNLAPGTVWLVQSGSFTNTGTVAPQIASTTSLGQFNLTVSSTFTAGGTLAPTLVPGVTPAKGTEFPFITDNGGSASGTFASVTGGFSADYTKETASPAFVGIIFGGSAAVKARAPKVTKVRGGAGRISLTLSCAAGAGRCATYTATGTVTEHRKGKKLVSIAAVVRKSEVTTRVVRVSSAHGTLKPGKSAKATLKLNPPGRALLKRFHTLKVRVVVRAGGKAIFTRTVTVTAPRTKKHKQHKK